MVTAALILTNKTLDWCWGCFSYGKGQNLGFRILEGIHPVNDTSHGV